MHVLCRGSSVSGLGRSLSHDGQVSVTVYSVIDSVRGDVDPFVTSSADSAVCTVCTI